MFAWSLIKTIFIHIPDIWVHLGIPFLPKVHERSIHLAVRACPTVKGSCIVHATIVIGFSIYEYIYIYAYTHIIAPKKRIWKSTPIKIIMRYYISICFGVTKMQYIHLLNGQPLNLSNAAADVWSKHHSKSCLYTPQTWKQKSGNVRNCCNLHMFSFLE